MILAASWRLKNAPFTFKLKTVSKSSSVVDAIGEDLRVPALATKISKPPKCLTVSWNNLLISGILLTSAWILTAFPPFYFEIHKYVEYLFYLLNWFHKFIGSLGRTNIIDNHWGPSITQILSNGLAFTFIIRFNLFQFNYQFLLILQSQEQLFLVDPWLQTLFVWSFPS